MVKEHIVLSPGEIGWVSVGSENCYGTPRAHLGSTSFSLNNTGDSIVLSYTDLDESKTTFDQVVYDSTWVEAGVSIQLSPEFNSSEANDDSRNWCLSTTPIENTTDFGTPGVENVICQ